MSQAQSLSSFEGKLLVTVYHTDDEAAGHWKKIAGLSDDKIIRIPTSDNFWAMGDTGPCGPCSEIFYDHGDKIPGGPPGSADQDGDRFIEIWNLVFMQFLEDPPGTRNPLPRPSIDTGMGLERLATVLQHKHNNYDIDLFRALIEAVAHETGVDPDGPQSASHKVIADHLRCSAFLIADGVMPANEGRGYVLRRIMRRGMRHAQLLGAKEPLMWRLVPVLIDQMGHAFLELVRAEALITEVLKLEEISFRRTLERGLRLLEEETAALPTGAPLAGEVAFRLYDTYGFPLDLTQDALRGQGRTVDTSGFDAAMARQREAARAAWKGSGESAVDPIWFDLREALGATEFLGYATTHAEGVVAALVVDGKPVDRAEPGPVMVVTNQTPFYGESGGQIGDTGAIRAGDALVRVTDTQKRLGDLWVHIGTLEGGPLAVGDAVELAADAARRDRIRRAHSATHLLHAALRRHLGQHVAQKGSLVAPDRLRFDFSQPRPMTADEIRGVEAEVNHFLRRNDEAAVRIMSRDDAIGSGAMALFGEKYGDEVRVVSMGVGEGGKTYSVELCGGTHVRRTGDIALFRIVSESAVAAGVRRVEAVTGELAYDEARREHDLLESLAQSLKTAPADLPARLEALVEERRRLERETAELRRKIAVGGGGAAANGFKQVGEVKFAARTLEGVPAKELRGTADAIKQELGSGVVALVSVNDGKAAVVVSVTEDLTGSIDAVELVRRGVTAVGGAGGGGRRDFAQGGGPEGAKAGAALAAIEAGLAG